MLCSQSRYSAPFSCYAATANQVGRYISVKKDVNSDVFDSEGYFKTGDLGKYEDGQLYVLGRQSSDGEDIPFLV